jgi:hypothetical protein
MNSTRRLLIVSGAVLALAACTDRGDDRVGEADRDDRPDVAAAPPTATDQPNRDADVEVTRQIRQAITSDDTMSTEAQNITIVTDGGVVTLRGSVDDEAERSTIAAIATRTPGVSRVDNQLEID